MIDYERAPGQSTRRSNQFLSQKLDDSYFIVCSVVIDWASLPGLLPHCPTDGPMSSTGSAVDQLLFPLQPVAQGNQIVPHTGFQV